MPSDIERIVSDVNHRHIEHPDIDAMARRGMEQP